MQPDLNNLKSKIQANRDFITRIAVGLPGFKGYVEKAENYDADRMVREFIADRVSSVKKNLNLLSGELSREADLAALPDVDSLAHVLEGVLKKVQYAEYGAAGPFSKIKITEEDQNRLLEFDWRLISKFDEILTFSGGLQTTRGDALKQMLKDIKAKVLDFDKTLNERKYVIMEVI